MRNHRLVTVLAAAALTAASGLAIASPAHAEDAIVKLVSVESGKCLQPVNGSLIQGEAIVQETCNGSVAQQWTVTSVSSTKVHLVNRSSRLCLDARGGATNGTPIQQWTCNSISNEDWQPGPEGSDDIPPLMSRVSGTSSYCLDIPGGQATAGLAMQIYRCNGTLAQQWWLPY